ncbi:PDZ domain-containing protein [Prosthecobacter sp.]|uniref:S1C family serine protease n=1 Tax=Prosthecobacter sp. TaxID=1965333 RepID=UPI002ABCE53C|nr:PDZ domain-containing protein [Prosthecobacter sp.]MDZ4404083.1 PDZ domain-containing protein [Prosthecobacter sp.]
MKLKHSFLIACLSAAPLQAQQEEKNEVKKAEAAPAEVKPRPPQSTRNPNAPAEELKPVAYIGVLTREVPAELRSQFSLPEGFGLMVDEVMPESPAQAAGLKTHDILVKFEDQRLVNMEQLMALVRSKKKGEAANLTVITGGKETQVPVTLGERMVAVNERRPMYGFGGWPQMGMPFGGREVEQMQRGMRDMGGEQLEQMERFQNEMREFQERLQNWMKGDKSTPMPQAPMFNMPDHNPRRENTQRQPGSSPRDGSVNRFNFSESHEAMNVTRRDDAGEYSMKREDGKTTFTVRPNGGKEQSWPVNTDEERKAVPEEFRDKLRMMDGAGSGTRIEARPGGEGPPRNPAPREGGNNSTQPRPQARGTSA